MTEALRLRIGGREAKEGWTVLNIQPGPDVDIVADCRDLGAFADAAVKEIYISHTLEHLGYRQELPVALAGMYRVLRPGGRLMISVPDLDVLCRLMIHEQAGTALRFHVMRMMFGEQADEWDFHKVGFTADLLAEYLGQAGFADIERVESFGLFRDASELSIAGVRVSLNVIAARGAE